MTWTPYPRRTWDPAQIDADIRNGTHARRTRAHHQAVTDWWEQTRPPLGRHHPAFPTTRQAAAA